MPPERSEAQRAQALEAAMRVRRERADLRQRLKCGAAQPLTTLEDDRFRGVRVRWFLESLPGIGTARADVIMSDLQIAESRRIGGLSDRQRSGLIARLGDR